MDKFPPPAAKGQMFPADFQVMAKKWRLFSGSTDCKKGTWRIVQGFEANLWLSWEHREPVSGIAW
jgi:hypothetical protein